MPGSGLPPAAHITYNQQYRRCKKPACPSCTPDQPGHGPYWYAYWREDGRQHSRYLGKRPPPAATTEPQPPPTAPDQQGEPRLPQATTGVQAAPAGQRPRGGRRADAPHTGIGPSVKHGDAQASDNLAGFDPPDLTRPSNVKQGEIGAQSSGTHASVGAPRTQRVPGAQSSSTQAGVGAPLVSLLKNTDGTTICCERAQQLTPTYDSQKPKINRDLVGARSPGTRAPTRGAPTAAGSATVVYPALRVRTLGGFAVWRGATALDLSTWQQRKAGALFSCLLAAPGLRLPREQLVDVLWPEADPAVGSRNLRAALHHLRALLGQAAAGEGYLRLQGATIQLIPNPANPPGDARKQAEGVPATVPAGWLDADAFAQAAVAALAGQEAGACRAALALYTGE